MFNLFQFNTTQFNSASSGGQKATNKRLRPKIFLSQRKKTPKIFQPKNRVVSRIAP